MIAFPEKSLPRVEEIRGLSRRRSEDYRGHYPIENSSIFSHTLWKFRYTFCLYTHGIPCYYVFTLWNFYLTFPYPVEIPVSSTYPKGLFIHKEANLALKKYETFNAYMTSTIV